MRGGNTAATSTVTPGATPGVVAPRHVQLPDIPVDNNVLFELLVFIYSALVLGLQYINLYKTVWWLPHSSAHYGLNFHLIDAHLCGLLVIITSRRLLYFIYKEVYTYKPSRACLYWIIRLMKLVCVGLVLIAFFYCSYHIVLKYSVIYNLFLCYPLVTYFILFRFDSRPFFGKVIPVQPSLWQQEKGGGTPRHRAGRGDNIGHLSHGAALPVHVCTLSPEAIRDEVETLKTDFNGRVTQILFDSMLCAYYMGCVPLCFAQNTLYYDTWWVGQHVGLVWISTFFVFAVHYLPAKYLDVFHRSALHLGRWVKVEGRHAHVPYTAWSELQVWQQGALVKHVKGLFKAEGISNAAEPGNSMHTRLYFMFHQPLRVITTMLLLTSALVLYQFYILAQATEWSHILSVSILLFSNYTTLFKLTRDRIVLGRAYGKEESSIL